MRTRSVVDFAYIESLRVILKFVRFGTHRLFFGGVITIYVGGVVRHYIIAVFFVNIPVIVAYNVAFGNFFVKTVYIYIIALQRSFLHLRKVVLKRRNFRAVAFRSNAFLSEFHTYFFNAVQNYIVSFYEIFARQNRRVITVRSIS